MSDAEIRSHIKKYGWYSLNVFDPDSVKPDFIYTIGLEESFNHPEVVIFGLNRDVAHSILGDIVEEIRNNGPLKVAQRIIGMVDGNFEVMFLPMVDEAVPKYLGTACSYYGRRDIRGLVMLWPDKSNVLPNEGGCSLTLQDEALIAIGAVT